MITCNHETGFTLTIFYKYYNTIIMILGMTIQEDILKLGIGSVQKALEFGL